MNNANVKTCSSCGEAQELDVAFCTNCGSRFKKKEKQDVGDGSLIGTQLLELANDFLSVREVSPARFVFSSQTGAQAPVEKVKIKFDAVAQLEPEKKLLMFWEQMVESSVGMNVGSIGEKKVQKGIAVTQKLTGTFCSAENTALNTESCVRWLKPLPLRRAGNSKPSSLNQRGLWIQEMWSLRKACLF
jgi:hypothetical protein